MAALVCGSLAYDTVMVYPGRFRDHILPDRIHVLNVSFVVPTLRRNFGGCAGNIAYNLRLLECDGHAMGTVGHDFGPYRDWMTQNGMSLRHVQVLEDEYTAQAYITTDLDANQLTAFHPGAMTHSARQAVPFDGSISIGVCAPDGRDGMIAHATQFTAAKIPFIFDPGQAMPLFNGAELRDFIELADYVTVNDYESNLLQERTGWSENDIVKRVKAYITTRGPHGSQIHTAEKTIDVPPAHERRVTDPTGCGDAYRAGLIFGLMRGYDLPTSGRMASLMGALKVEHPGTQNQRFDYAEFAEQFRQQFGYAL